MDKSIAIDTLRCSACDKTFATTRRAVACPHCGFRYVFENNKWKAELPRRENNA